MYLSFGCLVPDGRGRLEFELIYWAILMRWSRENTLAVLIVLLVIAANAVALWPELSVARVDLNDNVFHYALIERIVQAVQHGENPLDCWSAEWSLGFPVLRTYQPLAHLLVVGAWFAMGKSVSLMTVFTVIRFLSVVLLPLSFFAAARLLGFSRLEAAAAAILAPLVSTKFLYGMEYGSFTWAGTGLFPQAVATHFLLFSLGVGRVAIRTGKRLVAAGALVGLTLVSHLIYGYIAAFSLLLLVALPDDAPRLLRLRRVLAIGGVAFLLSAFQLLPLLRDASLINHSRWEPGWKWDSFGASQVLKWLFTGELLDHGRLPVLTLLAAAGAALFWWRRSSRVHAFAAAGAAFWILMYFGRPFWGPLLSVLGASEDMHLHRVIGGVHVFLVLLAALALAEGWRVLARRHIAAALAATALLLYPAVRERARTVAADAVWGRHNLAAHAAAQGDLDAAIASVRQRGGRAYAGLAATWGSRFKIGDVPVYAFLGTAQVPTVGFLYHSMALTGDVMVRFNDLSPAQYRLFNIRSVILPANSQLGPPGMLQPRQRFGNLETFEAPGGGYFDLVDVVAAVKTDRRDFYDINDRWLESDWPAKRSHLLLDWDGGVPPGQLRVAPDAALPVVASAAPPPGDVRSEAQDGETYRADFKVLRPSWALFKMTWHPNWKAYVDGAPQPVAMLSPGFPAVHLEAGQHSVEFRYEPGPSKPLLAFAGIVLVLLLPTVGRRAANFAWPHIAVPRPVLTAASLFALALPVCIRLFTGSLICGHDRFCYFPRVVEVHQNLIHGILLPRWAPDLGRGYGQPLFIFHPPMFYWLAEFWHLLGRDYVTAVNLACVLLVFAAAVAMFLLGRLYYGERGGWLAAAAYLYVPYFAVDLYVRSALEEFTVFPLVPLALYGFGAFALHRHRRDWILGAVAYALVLFCHFPAALLFTPVLALFLALTAWREKSWRVLGEQAAGMAFALGMAACMWLPALAEKPDVALTRVLHGNGDYANHFVYLRQLFYSPWGYGYSGPGPNDGMSFALGWSHLLLAAAAWIWIARRPKLSDRRLMRFFAATGIVLCILMLENAAWLWDHLPLLPYVELPWRLLGPVALCTAMLVGALGPAIAALRRHGGLAFAAAMALLIVPNLPHLQPGSTAEVDTAFYTPHELAFHGFETTTMGEMTPRWMAAVPGYTPAAAVVAAGDAQVRDLSRTPFSYQGQVTARTESRIRLSTAWFPGWTVRIDGHPAEAGPAPTTGLVEFLVPAGTHQMDLNFGRSPARRLGESISLFAVLALALWARLRTTGRAAAAKAAAASGPRS